MLSKVTRRCFSAAEAAAKTSSFDLFAKSRDTVGIPAAPEPKSDLKRKPSERVKKLVNQIMELSLIEAADLCDLCQEQLGGGAHAYPSAMFAAQMSMPQMAMMHQQPQMIQQAAPAAPAAAPEAAPEPVKAPAAAEKKPAIVSLKLVSFDAAKKVQTVKEVRAITNLGLKEAKEAVEAAPKILKKGVAYEEALILKAKLEEVGAKVELE